MTNHGNDVHGHKDNCVEPENPKFRVPISSDSKVTAENLVVLAVWASILTVERQWREHLWDLGHFSSYR